MDSPEEPVNPNGVWIWKRPYNSREWVLRLQLKGENLTGTITGYEGPAGDSTPQVAGGVTTIQDARIRGDVVSFREVRHSNGEKWSLDFAGKIVGDTIQGKVEVQRENTPPTIGDWQPTRATAK